MEFEWLLEKKHKKPEGFKGKYKKLKLILSRVVARWEARRGGVRGARARCAVCEVRGRAPMTAAKVLSPSSFARRSMRPAF